MQESATALIGNKIGAMDVASAKRYTKVLFVETFIIAMIVATALFTGRYQIFNLFMNGDKELMDLSLAVMPFFCFYGIPIDAALQTLQGAVRALGI